MKLKKIPWIKTKTQRIGTEIHELNQNILNLKKNSRIQSNIETSLKEILGL